MLEENNTRETHIIVVVVVHRHLHQLEHLAEVLVKLVFVDQLLLYQLDAADKGCLANAAVGLAGPPGRRWNQDHLKDNLGVKDDG